MKSEGQVCRYLMVFELIGLMGSDQMVKTILLAWAFIHSLFPFSAVAAVQFHKCKLNGSVHYQQDPCPQSKPVRPPTVEELNALRQKQLALEKEKGRSANTKSPARPVTSPAIAERGHEAPSQRSSFKCDGRKFCSQMTSCAEAEYFLSNCPGVEMDGDRDDIPCESQWCGR